MLRRRRHPVASSPPASAGPLLRRFLGVPPDLLDRVRWVFFLFLLFGIATSVPRLAADDIAVWPNQVVAALGAASLVVWALWTWQNGGRWRVADLIPAASMGVVGVMLGDPSWVAGQASVTLFYRSLFGSRTRSLANAVLYYAAHQAVASVVDGGGVWPGLSSLPLLVSFLVTAGLVSELARMVQGYQAAAAREVVLTEAGADLLAASSNERVHEVALRALRSLTRSAPGVSAALLAADDGVLRVVAADGVEAVRVPVSTLPEPLRDALLGGTAVRVPGARVEAVRRLLGVPVRATSVVVAPITDDDALVGALVVAAAGELDDGVEQTIGRLGVDLRLAQRRVELTEQLGRREALFRSVVESSSDVIAIVDTHGEVRFASPSIEAVLGYPAEAVTGRAGVEFLHPDDRQRFTAAMSAAASHGITSRDPFACRLRDADGAWHDAEVTANRIADGSAGIVLSIRDVSERKKLEDEITYRAYHDPLTHLANRALFTDRLAAACERMRRGRGAIAVALIDLDDFKAVNDNLGHASGDALLVEIGERLRSRIRGTDTAARLGGDEFALLLEDLRDAGQAVDVVERVLKSLRRPVSLVERVVSVHASVGLIVSEDADADPDELLRNADVAMYAAKAAGKGRYEIFESSMHVAALERLELRAELEDALERHQLSLHYQPIVDLETDDVVGFESLLRWDHPTRGVVAPGAFIPLAEESRLILPIGRWVVEEACRQLARWNAEMPDAAPLDVGVNLSTVQLLDGDLVDVVSDAVRAARIEPSSLIVEVTETALMHDVAAAAAAIDELKSIGVRIAIDDFGTGYSSFGYLRRFAVDILKVDQSFVQHVHEGPEEAALANAIIKLAQTLGMSTVAEGVELQEQAEVLRQWRCHYAQGYLFSPPLPGDTVGRWLDAVRARRGAESVRALQ